jgi:hypothetical protein
MSVPKRSEVEDALDLLLLRAWGMFNRAESSGTMPEDVRGEAVAALRKAHEALDAVTGTPPSFPYRRFEGGRLLTLPRTR